MSKGRIRKSENPPPLEKISWRIIFYMRLSKDDGNDESHSITNQRKKLAKHLQKLADKYPDQEHIYLDEFIDDGISGTTTDERENFLAAMRLLETGQANCLMCVDLSRFYRNYWRSGETLENLYYYKNIRFITLSYPQIDTYLNPQVMRDPKIASANVENDNFALNTSNKIRDTFEMKREEGAFIGAFCPYGYQKNPADKNGFLIDEEAAGTVREIYRLFVDQAMSKRGIAKYLTAQGVPTPTRYKKEQGLKFSNPHQLPESAAWSPRTVAAILANQVYLGHMVQGKQEVVSYKIHAKRPIPPENWVIVRDTHAPIIDKQIFEKAQALHKKDTRTPNQALTLHLMSGFVRCWDCKRALQRNANTKGSHVYYKCRSYGDKGPAACTSHSIREDVLIRAVLEALKGQIALIDHIQGLVEKINQAPLACNKSARISARLKSSKQELAKTRRLSQELYIDFKTKQLISEEQYRELQVRFTKEDARLQEIIRNLEAGQKALLERPSPEDPSLTRFIQSQNISQLSRGLLVELVDTVWLHEDKSLTIDFTFADPYQKSLKKP